MATLGNTTTPAHNWFEQGVNTPPNQVATAYTMPSPGGTITELHAYFSLVAGSGATAFICMWDASGHTILNFWSGAVATGSASTGGQQWNGGLTNTPVFVSAGTVVYIGFSVQQANGFITTDESSGSSIWNTVAPGAAPGDLGAGFSSTGHFAIGSYAVYTPASAWVWNGSLWVSASEVDGYNGSTWGASTGIQVWNGSSWVDAS